MSTDYLSTLGIGTGLNTTEIVDSLMEVERESRLSSITKKKDKLEAQISAYGELSEAFQTFKSVTDDLKSQSSVGYSVSTTDTKVLDAKVVGSEAQLQSTSVTVTSLASRQILTKSGYASATSEVGMGSMNIKFGTWSGGSFSQNSKLQSISVSIGATNNSLNGVAQSLNQAFRSAGIDANASVAKVSSSGTNDYMLMISSKPLKEDSFVMEKRLFLYSIFYLFVTFLLLLVEHFSKFFLPSYLFMVEDLLWI